MWRRNFYEESYEMVGQTCPAVDTAFVGSTEDIMEDFNTLLSGHLDDLRDRVKEQTGKLRDALVEAIKEREDLKVELARAEQTIEDLKNDMSPGWVL